MRFIDELLEQPFFPYVFALLLTLPLIVLARQFVFEYIRLKNKELKMLSVKGNAENKSHAYERLTLFLERIKPSNLVEKFDKDLAPHEFVYLVNKSIKDEYDYNAAQQLYLTKQSWNEVTNAKDKVVQILNETYKNIQPNTTLEEYKTIFLMDYLNGPNYVGDAIDQLKREVLLVT